MTSVIFLGTSAASPSVDRGFSCIGILKEDVVLLDCGDGAIRNILKFGVDVRNISNIFLTHYHSDHLSGLTQVIETMSIRKKQGELNVFGPAGLVDYLSTVQRVTNVAFHKEFAIHLKELSPNQSSFAANSKITTFEMDHTLPCLGYRIESEGKIISFTGDTQPCKSLKSLGIDSDIFIHEATYLQKDIEKARDTKHSSPGEAAKAAAMARTRRLLLTHVNDSYEKPEEMMKESQGTFRDVTVAYDGLRLDL